MNPIFLNNFFSLRRQLLALGQRYRIYDPNGQAVLYSKKKMFKLREDIRIYTDENLTQEILYIQARQIVDFSAAYDVYDQTENIHIGTLKRKGMKSMVRDEWEIYDSRQEYTYTLIEDSMTRALLRRFIAGNLLPQNYDILINGTQVADLRQPFNLFRYALNMDFTMDPQQTLDRRLGIAAGVLLAAIEGKQDSY